MGWVSPVIAHGSFGPSQTTVPCPLRQHVTQGGLTWRDVREAASSTSAQSGTTASLAQVCDAYMCVFIICTSSGGDDKIRRREIHFTAFTKHECPAR